MDLDVITEWSGNETVDDIIDDVKAKGFETKVIHPFEDEYEAGASCGMLSCLVDGCLVEIPRHCNGYCLNSRCSDGCEHFPIH